MRWIKWLCVVLLGALVYTVASLYATARLLAIERGRRKADRAYRDVLAVIDVADKTAQAKVKHDRIKSSLDHRRAQKKIKQARKLGREALIQEWRSLKR